jgi:hypothetical protein
MRVAYTVISPGQKDMWVLMGTAQQLPPIWTTGGQILESSLPKFTKMRSAILELLHA